MKIDRRMFLYGSISILSLISGCSDNVGPSPPTDADMDEDGVPNEKDDYPNNPSRGEQFPIAQENYTISPGNYKEVSFRLDEEQLLLIEVGTGGNPVDVLVLTESEREEYRNSDQNLEGATAIFTIRGEDQVSSKIGPGIRYVVFDNTSFLTDISSSVAIRATIYRVQLMGTQ